MRTVRKGYVEMTEAEYLMLVNPTLIIEVLSRSTENYDRGEKFQYYRTLTSLQEYVLISQQTPHIERYTRQDDDRWQLTDAYGLDASIDLLSVGCALKLAEIYEQIEFSDTPL
jgi:Uma2 family endonuclease